MYNKTNMMCPYAYILAGFMWFVRNGGKFFAKSLTLKKTIRSASSH